MPTFIGKAHNFSSKVKSSGLPTNTQKRTNLVANSESMVGKSDPKLSQTKAPAKQYPVGNGYLPSSSAKNANYPATSERKDVKRPVISAVTQSSDRTASISNAQEISASPSDVPRTFHIRHPHPGRRYPIANGYWPQYYHPARSYGYGPAGAGRHQQTDYRHRSHTSAAERQPAEVIQEADDRLENLESVNSDTKKDVQATSSRLPHQNTEESDPIYRPRHDVTQHGRFLPPRRPYGYWYNGYWFPYYQKPGRWYPPPDQRYQHNAYRYRFRSDISEAQTEPEPADINQNEEYEQLEQDSSVKPDPDKKVEVIPAPPPLVNPWKRQTNATESDLGGNLLKDDFPILSRNQVTKLPEESTCDSQVLETIVSARATMACEGSVTDQQESSERPTRVPEVQIEEESLQFGQNPEVCLTASQPFPWHFPLSGVTEDKPKEQKCSALEKQNAELRQQLDKLTAELSSEKLRHADAVRRVQETARLLDSEIKEKIRIQKMLEEQQETRHVKSALIKEQGLVVECRHKHGQLETSLREEVERLKTLLRCQESEQEKKENELQDQVKQLITAQTSAVTNIRQLEKSLSDEKNRTKQAELHLTCEKNENSRLKAAAELAEEKFKEQQHQWENEKFSLQKKGETLAAEMEVMVKQAEESPQKERKDWSTVNGVLLNTISDLKNILETETEERKSVTEKMLEKIQVLEQQMKKIQKPKSKWKSFCSLFKRKLS